jgi:hypothetical protein
MEQGSHKQQTATTATTTTAAAHAAAPQQPALGCSDREHGNSTKHEHDFRALLLLLLLLRTAAVSKEDVHGGSGRSDLHDRILAAGKPHELHVPFWTCRVVLPHRRHTTCVLLWRMPKL